MTSPVLRGRVLWRVVMAALAIGATHAASAQNVGAPEAGVLLMGDVVNKESGTPLAHAMVTVLSVQRQTFTSDGGVFAFRGLDPGRYRLRAVHIGYSPAEVTVDIPESGAPPRVKIALTHLSVQLATVKVTALNRCTTPGRPNPDVEPDFAAIVAQVRMNAELFKMLTDSFPFQYKVEREFYSLHADSSRTDQSTESGEYRSGSGGWEYHMGDIIERGSDGRMVMHLPTLADFAGYEFLNNHCFTYGGVQSTRDGDMIRIDFAADVQIRTPDVNGSVFLDAKTYQIRRAELQLTKMPPELPNASAIHATTVFGEVAPSIDIIVQVRGITWLRHHFWGSPVANGEDERMFGLEWLGGDPSRPRVQP